MSEYQSKIGKWWSDAPSWARGLSIGLVACLLISFAVWWALDSEADGDMAPLYTDLTTEDAASIRSYLQEHGIRHRVSSGGDVIEVPANRVHSVRLDLASQGVPDRGAVGFEVMDSMPWGTTDFERHVNYIRAIQGELERTIEGIEEVNRARVHVVLPQESVFISESSPATAAVYLELDPLREMTTDSVRGVMHLVASSVEGLEPEKVTVVNAAGVILSDRIHDEETLTGIARDSMDMQLQFERTLKGRLESMLEQVLGPGNVALEVSAVLNFDEREVQQEMFEPVGEDGLVLESHRVEETFSGTGAEPEAGAGTDSNVPSYYGYVGGGDSEYERIEETQSVVANRTTEQWTVAPGALEGLSVAVVVNDTLTPAESEMLEDVVAAAIGSDPERQDSVVISGQPFDTTLADQMQEHLDPGVPVPEEEPLFHPRLLHYAAAAVAAVFVVIAIVLRRRGSGDEEVIFADEKTGDGALGRSEEEREVAERRRALLESIGERGNGLRGTASEMADENPAKVADLLRTWLAEDPDLGTGDTG